MVSPGKQKKPYRYRRRRDLRRYKIEKELGKSTDIYRAIFEYTGTGMLLIDEDRTIVLGNREMENIIGYSRDEIEGRRKWDEFVHPEDVERMKRYHYERRKNEEKIPNNYEFRLIDARGNIINIFFTVGMIRGSRKSLGSMIDITERKNMEVALKESEERYRLLMENIEDVFYEVDLRGDFTFINDSVYRVFGFKKEELLGRNYSELIDHKNAREVFEAFNRVYNTGVPQQGFSWSARRPDGERREIEVSISPIRDQEGNITGFRGTARDITERKAAEEHLRYLSLHDPLTGLYNRAYFEEEMQRLEDGRRLPVLMICGDVDGLKLANDTLGHKKGDELLIAAAKVLDSSLRDSDMVARVGGDEFVVVLPETEKEDGEKIVKRIKQYIKEYNKGDPDFPLHISLGWSIARTKEELKDLFKEADDDMYRQKSLRNAGSESTNIRTMMGELKEKDFVEEGHLVRLQELAAGLARKAGLPDREVADVVLLAHYHDIGKTEISRDLLCKEEPLTEEERIQIREHCEAGYNIARKAGDLSHIAYMILAHHEWYDGSGWLGLKGDQIPVGCRILSIVDAFDAMTGKRPYRKIPLDEDKALEELRQYAGYHFDPRLVELFKEMMQEKRL